MSRSSSPAIRALIAWVLGAAGCLGNAQGMENPVLAGLATVVSQSGDATTNLAQPPEASPPVSSERAAKENRSMIRCWQDGRLVYEGFGFAALPKTNVTLELRPVSRGNGGVVQVIDLRQGLCVLELREPN